VSRDFLLLVFFMNQFPPSPRVFHLDRFDFFAKIRGDIRESRCTTGINNTGGKFAPGVNDTGGKIAAGIKDTGGKFATGISDTGGKFSTIFASVVDTGGKFSAGVNDAGGKLPPVSTTPAANLPPMSTTPVANNGNNIRLQTP
jgi:hypothetical protein